MIDPDELGRTDKIDLDDGTAATIAESAALARRRRLGIAMGSGWEDSATATAAFLTALRCGVRAFKGGVSVAAAGNPILRHGWGRGERLDDALARAGAARASGDGDEVPVVVVIGGGAAAAPATAIHATWDGWAGGVTTDAGRRLPEGDGMPLAGVVAGAIAVSEAFQAAKGIALAARRDAGVSLWRPDLDWRDADGRGASLAYLPSALWLLGVGHLGQANAWAIGSLPYGHDPGVCIGLVDPERAVTANLDTGLLLAAGDVGRSKARAVARELESRGLATFISERRFGAGFAGDATEPAMALAGFDKPEPRRSLEAAGLAYAVDAGLGRGARYLDIVLQSFPGSRRAADAFPEAPARSPGDLAAAPAYAAAIRELEARGMSRDAAACGVAELAGRTAGAAFVGAVAGALGVADLLRHLHGGVRLEAVSISLADAAFARTAPNRLPAPPNSGFVRAGT